MTWLVFVIQLLGGGQPANQCEMTYFGGVDDKLRGGQTPCLRRRVASTDWGIAMRRRKGKPRCGTLVWLRNPSNGKQVIAPIIDSGPYGAGYGKRWYIKKRRHQAGPDGKVRKWRACGDLTKPVSRALGHNGREPIQWEVLTTAASE